MTGITAVAMLLGYLTCGAKADVRMPLTPDMVFSEMALGDATKLVDEQNAIGDPAAGKGLRPEHPFFAGWTVWHYPVSVLIDLRSTVHVTRLFIYNETGEAPLTLSTGKPFQWKSTDVTLNGYKEWREFKMDSDTRYVQITLPKPASIAEIALYVDHLPASPKESEAKLPVYHSRVPVDQFIGTNSFITEPPDKMAAALGFVREYHDWQWDTEGPGHKIRFEPSGASGASPWKFDEYYGELNKLGVTTCPCIQQSNPVLFPGDKMSWKPVAKGADTEDPKSYSLHAAHLFQYAARYGSTHVPDSELALAEDQPLRSGLGSLRYIEDWNEPDNTWNDRESHFTPYELAAMTSADCDGDQGRLGNGFGVKSADPKMHLVMAGLSGIGLDYLRAMKFWSDVHRGPGNFPASAINLHHYSNDGNESQPFRNFGISPEADHVYETFSNIANWIHCNLPKQELWVTEFGYDTDPKSPIHSPSIGSYSSDEIQAIWLVRTYFALAAAGVDRAAMFMFRDVKTGDGGVFNTCGMVTTLPGWQPKPSYYHIATLKHRLAGYHFDSIVESGKPDVLTYRFTAPGGRTAYAVWCSTSEDLHVPDVRIPVSGRHAVRVDFVDDSLDGKASPITITNGAVTLEAREKPVLILVQ
jgi:hypothetical protein